MQEVLDRSSSELFHDSWTCFRLTFYYLALAIVKVARYRFQIIRAAFASWMRSAICAADAFADRCIALFQRHRKEILVCSNTFGWSLSGSLIAIQII